MSRFLLLLSVVALALTLVGCGDVAADRTVTIHQMQTGGTPTGAFPIDTSQLPADAIVTWTDRGSPAGNPVTYLAINPNYPIRIVLVPATPPPPAKPTTGPAATAPAYSITELPRPNSGTYSFAVAEARKLEILSNVPTGRLENWKNPYMGFCIHIAQDDRVVVYHYGSTPLGQPAPRASSAADIEKLADGLPLEGNPAGILITSDAPLKDSRSIQEVLKVLFVPSVQIFYARAGEPIK